MARRRSGGESSGGGPRRRGPARKPPPRSPVPSHDRVAPTASRAAAPTAPADLGDDYFILHAIDPWWAHACWRVHPSIVESSRKRAGDPGAPLLLRFRIAPPPSSEGAPGPSFHEAVVPSAEGSFYLNVWSPGPTVVADLGVRDAAGDFHAAARSNPIDLPPDAESSRYEVRWKRVLGAAGPFWKARGRPPETPEAASAVSPQSVPEPAPAPVAPAASAIPARAPPAPTPPAADAGGPEPASIRIPGAELLAAGRWEPVLQPVSHIGSPSELPPPGYSAPGARSPDRAGAPLQGTGGEFPREPIAAAAACDESPAGVEWAPPAGRAARPGEQVARAPAPAGPFAGGAGPVGSASVEAVSSEATSSWRAPPPDDRSYLEVRADLVIYGVAKPGSQLVIDGVAVPVRQDGTFDLRFSLPEGGRRETPDQHGGER